MKGRRKFQPLIADIRDALSDVARESRYGDLFRATWQLVRFEDELAGDIGKVREFDRRCPRYSRRDRTRPFRRRAEDHGHLERHCLDLLQRALAGRRATNP